MEKISNPGFKGSSPLVSCLCVSNGRAHFLKNALALFDAQTYDNKELVVVLDQSDQTSLELVSTHQSNNILPISIDTRSLSLGAVRNIAIKNARGVFICNWDDDDWFHCNRVKEQVTTALKFNKPAVVLDRILLHNQVTGESYLAMLRCWENSVLCNRNFLLNHKIQYSDKEKGEDHGFIEQLIKAKAIYPLLYPQLYIYNFTGANTYGPPHFRMLFSHSTRLNPLQSQIVNNASLFKDSIEAASKQLDSPDFMSELDLL